MARNTGATQGLGGVGRIGKQQVVEIREDGRGGVHADGNGMAGMRERVAALGGVLSVLSPRGEGTCLSARIPLVAASIAVPAAPVTPPGDPA